MQNNSPQAINQPANPLQWSKLVSPPTSEMPANNAEQNVSNPLPASSENVSATSQNFVSSQTINTVAPTPAAVQPVSPAFLTGSQLRQEKKRLPIGIYVIAAFNLIGFGVSFFDTSQTSIIYTIIMLFDLLLAVGLVLRVPVARKIMVWVSGLMAVLVIITSLMLAGLQQKIKQSKAAYETALSNIDQKSLTLPQKQQLNTLRLDVADKEKQVGNAITFTYIKNGVTAVGAIAVMAYLTRPKVKDVFEKS